MVCQASLNGLRNASLLSTARAGSQSFVSRSANLANSGFKTVRSHHQLSSRAQPRPWRAARQPQWSARRFASTEQEASKVEKIAQAAFPGQNLIVGAAAALVVGFGFLYLTDTRASYQRYVVVPLVRWAFPDAEDAHAAGITALKLTHLFGINPRERGNQDAGLEVDVFGHTLRNPLAVSAGLDKNGEAIDALFDLGPAVVEIGGITPLPQPGNEKPRVWRVKSQGAMINRYGLNSKGAAHIARQLKARVREFAKAQGFGFDQEAEDRVLNGEAGVPPGSLRDGRLLAIQVAKNKVTPDNDYEAVKSDYVKCVEQLGNYADVIVVNVSSPNTPGLRALQQSQPLKVILGGVVEAAKGVSRKTKPPVMVKVSPDESSEEDILGICEVVWDTGVDGVIVANTTKGRPLAVEGVLTPEEAITLKEMGGYSGPALFPKTLELVKRYRQALDAPLREGAKGETPKTIFASGGISNGDDVLKVCNAGASVAMSYTSMAYYGTGYFSALKAQIKEGIRNAVAGKRE